MNAGFIQNLRYKLQKRVRRLKSVDYNIYHVSLKQFLGYINSNNVFLGILADLEKRCPEVEKNAEEVYNRNAIAVYDDELSNAALSYFILKKCAEDDISKMVEVSIGRKYSHETKYDDCIDYFNKLFLEPFYEYLDEQLDDQKAMLSILKRYKHKCEWFQKNYLYGLKEREPRRWEKNLALHLYEYLYDQGIDFSIEPNIIIGEPDLVAAQNTNDPLIADAKIFDGEDRDKHYIAKGFNQVYQYTLQYNEPFGYMLIYKVCLEDLNFALINQAQFVPFIIHNNKTIFIVTIEIFPHEKSASQRGKLKSYQITEDYLVNHLVSE